MRLAVASAWLVSTTVAFAPVTVVPRRKTTLLAATTTTSSTEFDAYLVEGGASASLTKTRSRRVVLGSNDGTVLVSAAAVPQESIESTVAELEQQQTEDEYDPFADDAQLGKIQQFQEQQQAPTTVNDRLKQMDLQDIIATLILPSIALFAAGRWGYNRVVGKLTAKTDDLLDAFAREMLYHDGDMAELKLCIDDYTKRKLFYLPNKRDVLLKRYLEAYAKKKTISPQAISSLSYVLSVFRLSEVQTAQLLVNLTREMGTDKVATSGKLLFLGSRLLASPEGQAGLAPIKELIMSTYREQEVAETLVETSQQYVSSSSVMVYLSLSQTHSHTCSFHTEPLPKRPTARSSSKAARTKRS